MAWEVKKLGDVMIIERGGSPRPIQKYLTTSADGINWIKISDATASDKYIYKTQQKITKEGLVKTRLVKEGDFILSNSMSFGRPYIMKTTGAIHDGWLVLKEKDEKLFETEFLYYLLSSPYVFQQFNYLASGSTVRNLNISLVSSVKVPIPPLSIQKKIVSILNNAFETIAKAKENSEQNLKNAKEVFESYLQSVFENKGEGWEEKTLKEVCEKITDGTHQTPTYFDEGIIFLSSRNVTSGKIDWANVKYIDTKQHLEMHKRVAPRINDILLAKNGTTGVAAMVDRDIVFDIYVSLAHIRVLDLVNPHFMLYFINSPIAKKQFNKRLKGAGVPNLHLQEIREVEISFPKSIQKQKEIVLKLDILSEKSKKLEKIYSQKLKNLEDLKQSILQKAFKGELTKEVIV